MAYTIKADPLKRPPEYLDHETKYEEVWFLCPHCKRIYKAKISSTIVYPEEIDRAKEGVVVKAQYFCAECGDYAFQVDRPIANSVKKLIEAGIRTYSSCSGHVEKFGPTSFSYEQGALGIGEDSITYGPCISMFPDGDEFAITAFKKVFKNLKSTHKEMILLDPEEEVSPLYFFIAPVVDPKDFRRCGDIRREKMMEEAQAKMDAFVTVFVAKYAIEKRKLMKHSKEAKYDE